MAEPVIAEFTQLNGIPISVNLSLVNHWEPADDGTMIVFSNDQIVLVRESYDLVSEFLNPDRQADEWP